MTSVRELVRSCRRARRSDDVAAAMLQGLTGAGLPRLEREPDERNACFAARLIGRFLAWVESKGHPLDATLVSTAAQYLSLVAAHVADGDWEPGDRDAQAFLRTHTMAMVGVERRTNVPTPVEHENLLVSWLAAQAAMRPTEHAGTRLGRIRRRRLEKRFGPTPADSGDGGEGSGP
jgi:hypothetical protein